MIIVRLGSACSATAGCRLPLIAYGHDSAANKTAEIFHAIQELPSNQRRLILGSCLLAACDSSLQRERR